MMLLKSTHRQIVFVIGREIQVLKLCPGDRDYSTNVSDWSTPLILFSCTQLPLQQIDNKTTCFHTSSMVTYQQEEEAVIGGNGEAIQATMALGSIIHYIHARLISLLQ